MCSCQQFELYRAEVGVPRGRKFYTEEALQLFVDSLRDHWWWKLWYPQVLRVEAYKTRSTKSVGGWYEHMSAGKVEMGVQHSNELIVLHELSHVFAEARYGSKSHDPFFARTYLELVAIIMGADVYQQLYDQFEREGIEHDVDTERLGCARRMPPVEVA